MKQASLPQTRDIVLIGGGHTHALFLRMWGMNPLPGARVTVINPGPTAPYSGMLPGHVAGHYDRSALDIDLVRLARFAGARVVVGAAEGLDLAARTVLVPGRPPVAYDICSIDIGITSAMPDLPGFAGHAMPAKPLGPFAERWAAFLNGTGPARVAIIGGGVAGAELALAMSHALRQRGREGDLTLIDAARPLDGLGTRARDVLMRELQDAGVAVRADSPIDRVEHGAIHLTDGQSIEADFITGAAGARPYDWLKETGLDLHDGFVSVGPTLQSSDPTIFATGDCAHLSWSPRPKAGVYAVRQAPVLVHNIRAMLTGKELKPYKPQGDYLKLISLGRKAALGEKFGHVLHGKLIWRWKDGIDQRFMDKFRDLPKMPAPALPRLRADGVDDALGERPLCGGCGAKVGRRALQSALGPAGTLQRTDIEPLPGDDAALLRTGGARQVISADHLRALTEDPVLMARIAAHHALGDIWAMGASPQAALATIVLPRLSDALQARTLAEIMAAARAVMGEAGADIVGGHTSVGDELTVGFTVTGLCDAAPITLAGGRAGDALILTKPIGSGTLMAAEMEGAADGAHVLAAWDWMCQGQGAAAAVLSGAHAMTDVTGFGLAGHLLNICEASGVAGEITLDSVPMMDGAAELSAQGIRSSIYPENRALVPDLPDTGPAALLFDPQTSGGLLAAMDAGAADGLVEKLRAAGYSAARIGRLVDGPPGVSVV
ncbi:selenide, water dikinase SelD [Chachezhania antarctica]|uniref:selenide, water dikinase SelD n=1 Tax=Chachezhania antarctica TaxID=2340860 RepID=UPI000EB1F0B2|nr:selenide, water dikinase SelD [Chachezhania antarctica]